jgi:mitotic spindle assembly checkpoint protein MAD2
MSTAQAVAPTRQHLTLSGSSLLVRDFFCYSLQSILYQRALYPPEDFKAVRKYGLQMLVAIDDALATYIDAAMRQLAAWLEQGAVSRVVVAIVDTETGDTVERWQFDVDVVGEAVAESKLAKEEKK